MTTMQKTSRIERVTGRAVPVRGNDIDTDRIIPARFLKTITFEGLEQHLFEDDRQQLAATGVTHPIEQPAYQGARLMLVQSNFGCGSSREHAPQAIARWGVGAIVGVSFAEIFFGNALMIGLPCATVSEAEAEQLLSACEANPSLEFDLDLRASTLRAGDLALPVSFPESARSALLSGDWDATALLIDHYEDVARTAARLPYVAGWDRRLA
jgi:3-isopropylmalate/(R)-2-methylmalate dehydratase small subunit